MAQLAAQLYTVREFTKTPADITETMKKVAAIGYRAVNSPPSARWTRRNSATSATAKA